MPPLAGCSRLRRSAPVGLPQIANPKRLAQGETRAEVGVLAPRVAERVPRRGGPWRRGRRVVCTLHRSRRPISEQSTRGRAPSAAREWAACATRELRASAARGPRPALTRCHGFLAGTLRAAHSRAAEGAPMRTRFLRPFDSVAQHTLAPRARDMRMVATESEARLWAHLRRGQLGVRFRRQVVLGPFIVDFLAPSARLIVEVDGGVHLAQQDADKRRDEARRSRNVAIASSGSWSTTSSPTLTPWSSSSELTSADTRPSSGIQRPRPRPPRVSPPEPAKPAIWGRPTGAERRRREHPASGGITLASRLSLSLGSPEM